MLTRLWPLIPRGNRLIEPFVGAGSVFLSAIGFVDGFVINDANAALVALWRAVKERPDELIQRASSLFRPEVQSAHNYCAVREAFCSSEDGFERAVRLLYLNAACFNGLYRVNASGRFNVPYGRPKYPRLRDERIRAAATQLRKAVITEGDFATAMRLSGEGDVVYCDPPYIGLDRSKPGFTAYTKNAFGDLEHKRLVAEAVAAVERGASVVISNHDTADTRALYAGFELTSLQVRRSVAAQGKDRKDAAELVAVLRP